MAKQVKNSDLVQPKLWQETVKETEALITVLGNLEAAFKKVSAEAAKTAKNADPGSAKGIKDINSATETLKKTSIEADKVRAQIAKAEAQRTRAAIAASKQRASQEEKAANKRQKAATDLIKQRKAAEEATKKEADQVIRLTKQKEREAATTAKATARILEQNRAYNKESRTLNELRKRFKDLAVQNKENTREGRKLLRQITFLDAKLKSVDKTVGQSQRNVGNYSSAFKGLRGGIASAIGPMVGITAGIAGVAAGITATIGLFREFGLETSKVRAVSGATDEEFQKLTEDAKRLGEATQFTATEVAGLQLVFARGGFSPEQIVDATEATLQLAIATGSELNDAARVVSSSLGAFGAATSDSQKFVDVFTKSLNRSNQSLEDFEESSKLFAPIAKVLGISVEESSAAIGILADNGLRGSIATTSLSTSLTKLTDQNGKAAKAAESLGVEVFNQNGEFVGLANLLGNVNEATADLNDQQKLNAITQIFGARATKNFSVLLNAQKEIVTENGKSLLTGADALRGFTKELENAAGTAKETSDIIANNLDGDIKRLESAFQGLILQGGALDTVFRSTAQGLTRLISAVSGTAKSETELGKVSVETARRLSGEAKEARKLVARYKELTEEGVEPTAKEKRELSSITLRLKDILGDTAVEIDNETKSLRLNLDATKDLLAQKVLLASEAATSALQNIENNKAIIENQELLRAEPLSLAKSISESEELARVAGFAQQRVAAAAKGLSLSDVFGEEEARRADRAFGRFFRSSSEAFKAYGEFEKALVQVDKTFDTQNRLIEENVDLRKQLGEFLTPTQIASLLGEAKKLNTEEKKANEETKKGNELKEEEIKTIATLRQALSDLRKEKNSISVDDKEGIARKQVEIDKLKEEIDLLEKLGKVKKVDKKTIEDQLSDSEVAAQKELEERKLQIITDANDAAQSINEDATIDANEKAEQLSRAQAEKDEQLRLAKIKNLKKLIAERAKLLEGDDQTQLQLKQELNAALLEQTEELINVEAELQNDAAKAQQIAKKKQDDEAAKATEKTEAQRLKDIAKLEEEIKQGTIDAIDVIDQAFAKSSQNRLDEIDRETAALKTREDALRQAAQNGSELAEENLATNQRLQAEQERIRDEQVKKAQRRELILAGLKAFAENAGEPGAVGKTLSDITTLSAALINLNPFFHGTDDTGKGGAVSDSYGAVTGYTHEDEMVLSKKDRGDIGFDKTRVDIKDAFAFQDMHQFDQVPIIQVQRFESNTEVLQKFDVLAEKLDNLPHRMPRIVDEKFDEKSKVYKTVIKTGNKVENNHRKVKGIWG